MLCAFPGCDNPRSPKAGKGLCNSHYWQYHKGRPLTPLSYRRNVCEPWLQEHVNHDDDECLIWPFQRDQGGRAMVKHKGRTRIAARIMCEMAHGKPPSETHEAAHSCGKGHEGCVNPKHLRWATRAENEADKVGHGTAVRGERAPWAKLTEAAVREIRELDLPAAVLSERFGVRASTIWKVRHGQRWRHI